MLTITAEEQLDKLRVYIDEEAALAAKSSHEWQPDQSAGITNIEAAYRSGMWYAFNEVRNKLGPRKITG